MLSLTISPISSGCGARVAPDGQDAAVWAPEFGIGNPRDSAPGRVCTESKPLPFAPRPADVLVLFDRSESMDLALGDRTRYDVAAQILRDLMPVYDDKIRFGFQAFPAKAGSGCADDFVSGCCAEPPLVAVAQGASAPILAALQSVAPASGNTPTAFALQLAGEHFAALADGITNRYVLLSTDGSPSCTLEGKLPPVLLSGLAEGSACNQALMQVTHLVESGVKVIVLGIGSDVAADTHGEPSCLESLARAGGVERQDGGPGLFLASDQAALELALQTIFGAVMRPSCAIDLKEEPTDPEQVRVRVDGREIPRNRIDGWDYEPRQQARHLQLFGEPCRRLGRFQFVAVEVEFGCSPCGQGGIVCE
jgi:hypothetical protein